MKSEARGTHEKTRQVKPAGSALIRSGKVA